MGAFLNRHNLTDAVTREIKNIILNKEVEPGGWLPSQPDIARRFGVGLSTVREAIKGLTLMGVLEPQPGRGTQVSPEAFRLLRMADLCREQLQELGISTIYEARQMLEVELAGLAAERATEKDLAQIETALEKMRQSIKNEEAFYEADLEFHFSVARASKNSLLQQFYRIVMEMLTEVMQEVMSIPSARTSGVQEQQDILTTIRSRDPNAARQCARVLVAEWGRILQASLVVGK